MRHWKTILLVSAIIGVMLSLGCAEMRPALTPEQLAADPPLPETLVPGDEIEVKFYYTPELNEKQMIRPDGTITMQLLGKVRAQGKTPKGLKRDLLRLYAPELKHPEIEVIVRNKSDRKVYVGGEVKSPGLVEIPGELSVLEAIKRAGGFKRPEANTREVLLVRQEHGEHVGCVLDMQKVLEGQAEQVVYLHPRDVVYVPPTSVTRANDWVSQFISNMLPRIPIALAP
jgi:protein involved in polysaccharide export with SLBB domain